VGWVVGHSYIVYGPLLAGCTTILYEGKPVGTPDAGAFWRVIAQHKVKSCSPRRPPSAPSSGGPDGRSCSQVRPLEISARCSWPASAPIPTRSNGREKLQLKVPVIDHWWQTETGWCDRRQLPAASARCR
jgi:propionyl-CoA synthetase